MEKDIRSKLQNATQAMRRLLEEDFDQQLEGVYDLLPAGTVVATPGAHLDARGRLLRAKLVAAFDHHCQRNLAPRAARAALVREAAFTTLNRFAALKLAEARQVIRESVSRGDQSSGFKEFCTLAEGLVALPDKGYRLYIESICDELGREVRVLFDRREVAGILWPRPPALAALLAILNGDDLRSVWSEDETLGWIYQYFNGEEERREMRKSAAPRNSRELAVRNQFFTPRYVVAFLADNTLGRLWYEMQQGATRLKSACDYLVYRPNERFLAAGEQAPAAADDDAGNDANDHAGDHADGRPVYIPHRARKDPRDLKVIDIGVGSAHFLMVCFGILQIIYAEALALDEQPVSHATGRRLRDDYPDLASLHRALPALILRHNLHGIDIDPRAAQIAELGLWLRAQRAYHDLGVQRDQRAPIRKTNIVVAEPMPGDAQLLAEFVGDIDPHFRSLAPAIWQAMQPAGEAGSLLRMEQVVRAAIRRGREETLAAPTHAADDGQLRLAADNVDADPFWTAAEANLLEALKLLVRQARGAEGMRRRLFAENVEQGVAFIELCLQTYDVALMNPPFGAASTGWKAAFEQAYPRTKNDLYAAFVERGLELLAVHGLLGAITSRTGFFLSSFQKWREEILLKEAHMTVMADLGYGVLDAAMVETAAYVLEKCAGDADPLFHPSPTP